MRLIVVGGPFDGKSFQIEEGNNLVGRWDPDNVAFPEIDLEEADIEAKISRKHAVVERHNNAATLEDIGSLNGTFLLSASGEETRLEPGQKIQLKDGQELLLGKTRLKFVVG